MATIDTENMLFDIPSSVDDSHESYEDDDDILDLAVDDEFTNWELQNDVLLGPESIDQEGNGTLQDQQIYDRTGVHMQSNCRRPIRDKNWVINHIRKMFEDLLDALLGNERLCLTLRTRSNMSRRLAQSSQNGGALPEAKTREISFPGSTEQEAWNFTVLLRILELIHSALIEDTVVTKRDIYYRHPDLFVAQSTVDRYVDDLACTLGVGRTQLNVTAAAKGLVAGNFTIWREDGSTVKGLSDKEGILVPKVCENDVMDLCLVSWILIIEKEATFRSLLSSSQWCEMGSRGLVLTAKGYPDLASRKFLCQLVDRYPNVPMFAFVDFDPDGIAIMSTYKHGSCRLAHEDATPQTVPSPSLPHLRWLGVQSHQIRANTTTTSSDAGTRNMEDMQGLMRMTVRDRMKAVRMLEWNLCAESGPEPVWRRELQAMLVLNVKAELQILEETAGGLASWLRVELGRAVQAWMPPVDSTESSDELLF